MFEEKQLTVGLLLLPPPDRWDAQPQGPGRGLNINEEKDKDVPEKVTAKFMLKNPWEIFHNTGSAKDKMLGADPNLERSVQLGVPGWLSRLSVPTSAWV